MANPAFGFAPAAETPKIVYSGRTLGDLAVNFRDTAAWCP